MCDLAGLEVKLVAYPYLSLSFHIHVASDIAEDVSYHRDTPWLKLIFFVDAAYAS